MNRLLAILLLLSSTCMGQFVQPIMSNDASNPHGLDPYYTGGLGSTVSLNAAHTQVTNTGGTFVSLSVGSITTDSVYVEIYVNSGGNGDFGVAKHTVTLSGTSLGYDANGWGYLSDSATTHLSYKANSGTPVGFGATFKTGDTVMIAYNGTSGKLWWGKNGTWQGSGNPTTGANPAYTLSAGTYYIAVGCFSGVAGSYTFRSQATTYRPSGWHGL
jgi:hypothetical protein